MSGYIFQAVPASRISTSTFSGINDSGEAVGNFYLEGFLEEPFLYNPTSSAIDGYVSINISTLSGAAVSQALATSVNSSGEVVGSAYTSEFNGVLDDNNVFTEIDYPAATSTTLAGINDSGQIVGNYTVSGQTTAPGIGFIWSNGSWTILTGPPGSAGGVTITGVNNSGEVVGYSDATVPNPFYVSGVTPRTYTADVSFVYDNGKYTPLLGPEPGLDEVFATSINNNGVVAGYYEPVLSVNSGGAPALGPAQGFVYESGQYTTINEPGASATYLSGINDSGDLIGNNGGSTDSFLATPDILWQSASGQVALWDMDAANAIGGGAITPNPGSNWRAIGSGEFYGDGDSDILFQAASSGQVAIWEMNGTNVVGGGNGTNVDGGGILNVSPGPSWQVIGDGDFYGRDQDSDILLQNPSSGQVAIWEMNGTNIIGGGVVNANPGPGWKAIGKGDFAGNGDSDLLFQDTSTGQVAVWEMNGTNIIGGGVVNANPGPGWRAIGTGDFTGDGDSDILFQSASTGQVAIWEMNGTNIIGGGVLNANPGPGWAAIGTGGEGSSDILFQSTSGQAAIWEMSGTTPIGGGAIGSNPGTSWKATGLT
jgi:hypothetical protein